MKQRYVYKAYCGQSLIVINQMACSITLSIVVGDESAKDFVDLASSLVKKLRKEVQCVEEILSVSEDGA